MLQQIVLVTSVIFLLALASWKNQFGWLLLCVFVAIFISLTKAREHYTNVLTQDVNQALDTNETLCAPFNVVDDALLPDIVKSRELFGVVGNNSVCRIRKENPVFSTWKCENNPRVLGQDGVVTSVQEVQDMDVVNSQKLSTAEYCEITFSPSATTKQMTDYARKLKDNDPSEVQCSSKTRRLETLRQQCATDLDNERSRHGASRQRIVEEQQRVSSMNGEVRRLRSGLEECQNKPVDRTREFQLSAELNKASGVNRMMRFETNPSSFLDLFSSGPRGNERRCVDIGGWATHTNAPTIIWDCHGGANQKWAMDEKNRLRSRHSGTCLSVASASPTNGEDVVIQPCTDEMKQKWYLDSQQRLRNGENPNKCIDLWGVTTRNGTPVRIFDCHSDWNQRFNMK
jgi:hypothetical protein